MNFWRIVCLLVTLHLSAFSAQIVGWKIPLETAVWQGLNDPSVERCEEFPENSPFFQKGDEVWDIKKALGKQGESVDWAVWNARSKYVIIKGGIAALSYFDENYDPAIQCRLELKLFEVPADGSDFSDDSKMISSVGWVTRSGFQSEINREKAGDVTQVAVEIVYSNASEVMDVRLNGTVGLAGGPLTRFNTSLFLLDGRDFWVIRDQGIDAVVNARMELTNGAPLSEFRYHQKNNELQAYARHAEAEYRRMDDGAWLMIDPLNSVSFRALVNPDRDQDPFADVKPEPQNDLAQFNEIEVPEQLKSIIRYEKLLDVRPWLESVGVKFDSDESFAGYDPYAGQVICWTKENSARDLLGHIFQGLTPSPLANLVLSFNEDGQSRIAGRSGQRFSLIRSTAENHEFFKLITEPIIEQFDSLIDMRLEYHNSSKEGILSTFKSATTLTTGEPLEIFSESGESLINVTGTIVRMKP